MPFLWQVWTRRDAAYNLCGLRLHETFIPWCSVRLGLQLLRLGLLQQPVEQKLPMKFIVFGSRLAFLAMVPPAGIRF